MKKNEAYTQLKASIYDLNSIYLFDALIFVKNSDDSINLLPGDMLISTLQFRLMDDITIPYAFSPSEYYKSKGISHSGILNKNQIFYIKENAFFTPFRTAWLLNRRLVQTIGQWPGDPKAKEIAIALLSGTKDFLSEESRMIYSETGIIHVLAVSGLHTGLIYVLLSWILNWLIGHRLPVLKSGIIIFFLWFYAMLTGFSPSVIRAATMFSFIQIGQSLQRKTGIFHSLAVSALTLLTFHPFLLFEIGFQLSYSAVFGIVLLSTPLQRILSFSNHFLLNKVTELLSVSIGAQVFTAPFTLYYFSQFPVYFFLANLFAIPIVTLVVYIGFPMALICSFFPELSSIGILPVFLIECNTYLAEWLRKLPLSVVKNIFLSSFQFALLLIIVLFLSLSFVYRKKSYLYFGLALVILFQVSQVFQHFKMENYALKVGLFSFGKEPIIILHSGRQMTVFSKQHKQLQKAEKIYLSKFKKMEKINSNYVDYRDMFDIIEMRLLGEQYVHMLTKESFDPLPENSLVINVETPEKSYFHGDSFNIKVRKSDRNSYWIFVF